MSIDRRAGRPPPACADRRRAIAAAGNGALYRQMWGHAAGARGQLVAAFALLVASQLVKLFVPWLAAQAIDALQTQTHAGAPSLGASAALPWIGAIMAVLAASWTLHGPGRVLERSVAVRVRHALCDRLYARLVATPLAWHDRHHPGELQQRIAKSGRALYDFTQSQFLYLQSAVNLLGPLVALTILSAWCGGIAAFGFAVVAAIVFGFDRALMLLAHEENTAERRYGAALLDCLANVSTVLALRLGASTRRTLARRVAAADAPLARSIALNEWKWCVVDLATAALTWLLVAAFVWRVPVAEGVLLGSLFMVYQYAQQAGSVVGSIAANQQSFARMRTDFASAEPIRSAPRRKRFDRLAAIGNNDGAPARWQRIEIRDLHYEHGPRDEADALCDEGNARHDAVRAEGDGEHVLDGDKRRRGGVRGASFAIERGERVAVVGSSGSGKSTLLRVLAGLYEPARGHVAVDGVVHLGVRAFAEQATLIPQEAQIFEGSVRDNLAFDLPHDDAAIREATEISGFDTVLAGLPDGLDAAVAAGGFNLSGGQRQRLCLARGVLAARRRSLLLLDEPTSALDPLTEALVFRRIGAAFPDAAIVTTVHRMSLLAHFDRVVLMDAGVVVDSGKVEALAARQPLFKAMLGGDPDLRDAA